MTDDLERLSAIVECAEGKHRPRGCAENDPCRVCGAGPSQNCGPRATAAGHVVDVAPELIAVVRAHPCVESSPEVCASERAALHGADVGPCVRCRLDAKLAGLPSP